MSYTLAGCVWIAALLSALSFSRPALAQKNLLDTVCPQCGAELQNIAQKHQCRPASDDCRAAKSHLRKFGPYTEKDISSMDCTQAILIAQIWDFKTNEELREEAKKAMERKQEEAAKDRRHARDLEEQALIDRVDSFTQGKCNELSASLDAATTSADAQSVAALAAKKAESAKQVEAEMLAKGMPGAADAFHSASIRFKDLAENARSKARHLVQTTAAMNDAAGLARDLFPSAEYGRNAVGNLEGVPHSRWPRIRSVLKDAAAEQLMDLASDPSSIYGGVDPVGIATDNMETLWPDDVVRSTLVNPVKAAGRGIENVFATPSLHPTPRASFDAFGEQPYRPVAPAPYSGPTHVLYSSEPGQELISLPFKPRDSSAALIDGHGRIAPLPANGPATSAGGGKSPDSLNGLLHFFDGPEPDPSAVKKSKVVEATKQTPKKKETDRSLLDLLDAVPKR